MRNKVRKKKQRQDMHRYYKHQSLHTTALKDNGKPPHNYIERQGWGTRAVSSGHKFQYKFSNVSEIIIFTDERYRQSGFEGRGQGNSGP